MQLRAVQDEIAALKGELGLDGGTAPGGGALERRAEASTPIGDLSAELERRLSGLESPEPAAAPQQREEEEKEEEQQASRTKLMHTVQALHLENQRLRRDMADVRQEVCVWEGAGRRESIRNHVTVYDLHTRVSTTDTH